MNNEKFIKAQVTVDKVIFYKDDWGVFVATVDKVFKGTLLTDPNETTFTGVMPKLKAGEGYTVTAEYAEHSKYGPQYALNMIASSITLDDKDPASQRKFLESIFTQGQVKSMYEALPDPYRALKDGNAVALVNIKGCGLKNATSWINKFKKNYHRSLIFAELSDYNLSASIIDKLLNTYKTPEMVIQKVKEDPYVLVTDVRGIGWKIADNIAVAGGMALDDPKRIKAYIYQYMDDRGNDGYSWITEDEFLGAIFQEFGEDIKDELIIDAVQMLEPYLWRDKEEKRIGLKYFYTYESRIAEQLLRIRNAESRLTIPENWMDAVHRIERLQGWEYTDEQINVIKKALYTNVILIQGHSGTGKSSLVKAILEVYRGRTFVQCAFSGKAASRLMEVTGQDGYTIHRLLGYPQGEPEHQGFRYHEGDPLTEDIYIVDEISMVDMKLFYYLLRAIPNGAKVICLGDNGQLEAIGAGNIAYDLLISPEIESCTLTKIHRQAEESAIVTESLKIKNRQQIIPEDWVGHEVRGQLQDLDITCYSDPSNTYYEVMKAFNKVWNEKKHLGPRAIMDIQVIVPMKNRGASTYQLNNVIQEICNPGNKEKVYIDSQYGGYYLKVGDKVINTVNNYKTHPNIYNGNVGIVKGFGEEIDEKGETCQIMTIDFDSIGEVDIPYKMWKAIELSYALTVHKIEGSEMDTAIFGFDYSAFTLLSKELVYTGITRAKKKCYLIAQNRALRFATTHSEVRQKQTHLQRCLHDLAHPVIIF